MKNEMSYQGRMVTVVERNGGWTTILDGMKQLKVHNSELSAPVDGKANRPAKAAKPAKAEKPAKAAKAPKEPKPKSDKPRLVSPDLTRYAVADDVVTASGRKAIDVGDEVATQLRGSDLSDVYKAASEATGVSQKALREQYGHLNPGMQRMNLGNRIRGAAAAATREAEKATKAEAKAAAQAAKPPKAKKAAK